MHNALRVATSFAVLSLLAACSSASSSEPSAAEQDVGTDEVPTRIECPPYTVAAFMSRTNAVMKELNTSEDRAVSLQDIERGTNVELTITSSTALNTGNAPLVDPVAYLVRKDVNAQNTCGVVATSKIVDSKTHTARLEADGLAEGDYFFMMDSKNPSPGGYHVVLERYDVPVPILQVPEKGDPYFVNQAGEAIGDDHPELRGYQPGRNLQVRYDANRLFKKFPQCILSDPEFHADGHGAVFMGVKLDGKDVPNATVDVSGVAEGDGSDPVPLYGDIDLSSNPTSLSIYFFCKDREGNSYWDNNGQSGGAYPIPQATVPMPPLK